MLFNQDLALLDFHLFRNPLGYLAGHFHVSNSPVGFDAQITDGQIDHFEIGNLHYHSEIASYESTGNLLSNS